ncbi:MAG: formylglycine-generating enzyme family protein [Nitrospiria bacterium]
MVAIPAGEFIMGTDAVDDSLLAAEHGIVKPWFVDEGPAHKVYLPLYYIDKNEVTNAEYAQFLKKTNHAAPPYWENEAYPEGQDQLPVVMVKWEDAQQYCHSKGGRLPSEAEWEKAAKGADGRMYPWGETFDIKKANIGGLTGNLQTVGSYDSGISPYGTLDMIGNAWEWTADWYRAYPGSTYKSDKFGQRLKVIRGNSWSSIGHFPPDVHQELVKYHSTTTFRLFAPPEATISDVGFRCIQPA